jgi:hypothetical protein
VTAHAITIETSPRFVGLAVDLGEHAPGGPIHRWRCSCERTGDWKHSARKAREGGARHVAAMERKR